jgi:hypothetical protein
MTHLMKHMHTQAKYRLAALAASLAGSTGLGIWNAAVPAAAQVLPPCEACGDPIHETVVRCRDSGGTCFDETDPYYNLAWQYQWIPCNVGGYVLGCESTSLPPGTPDCCGQVDNSRACPADTCC